MTKSKFFLAILIALIVTSCVKELDDELPKPDPRLVVNGILNPDSSVRVNISRSFDIFQNENINNSPFISIATVKFYENSSFISELNYIEEGEYVLKGFFPDKNKTYKLTAEAEGFDAVDVEINIPETVLITGFDTLSRSDNDPYYETTSLRGILHYTDPVEEDNYYMLECYVEYYDEFQDTLSYRQYIYVDDIDDYRYTNANGTLLWDDQFINGNETTVEFTFMEFGNYYEGNPNYETFTFKFLLKSVNRDYFLYEKTRNLYLESGGSENPFSEPVIIYTNIHNGYGIFGAESASSVNFTLNMDLQ
ncbi:MAG: DUF4249 domain-containing protein [Bacteroidales bacterium]|nr:DUF4249 domain-containing protein [Bacteroidales bacterium]MCF8403490.1 DUF4249 domain-containing protein [Bacteroidales bacterium]